MVADARAFRRTEFACAQQHATKPQSLAVGLNDSPAGLAAWTVEKFRAWSDCHGNLESRFTKDELLCQLTVYWATQTIGSSIRLYCESMHRPEFVQTTSVLARGGERAGTGLDLEAREVASSTDVAAPCSGVFAERPASLFLMRASSSGSQWRWRLVKIPPASARSR